MAPRTKVRRIKDSLGLIIPKAVVDAMGLREGDELFVVQTSGGITLTPYDPDSEEMTEDARTFMRSHREAFRRLSRE